jgi:hypothetical protein
MSKLAGSRRHTQPATDVVLSELSWHVNNMPGQLTRDHVICKLGALPFPTSSLMHIPYNTQHCQNSSQADAQGAS